MVLAAYGCRACAKLVGVEGFRPPRLSFLPRFGGFAAETREEKGFLGGLTAPATPA